MKMIRPLVPATAKCPAYPGLATVWRMFAAGAFSFGAVPTGHADCALPEHTDATHAVPVGAKKQVATQPTPAAAPSPRPAMPGVPVPVPGGRMPVIEGKTRAPEPTEQPDPKSKHKPKAPELDGRRAVVEHAFIYIHPHGPDEPCLEADPETACFLRFG